MTKREKLECSTPDCHKKRQVNIQLFKNHGMEEVFFCEEHFLEWMGFMTIHFSKSGYKKEIMEGIFLYK